MAIVAATASLQPTSPPSAAAHCRILLDSHSLLCHPCLAAASIAATIKQPCPLLPLNANAHCCHMPPPMPLLQFDCCICIVFSLPSPPCQCLVVVHCHCHWMLSSPSNAPTQCNPQKQIEGDTCGRTFFLACDYLWLHTWGTKKIAPLRIFLFLSLRYYFCSHHKIIPWNSTRIIWWQNGS